MLKLSFKLHPNFLHIIRYVLALGKKAKETQLSEDFTHFSNCECSLVLKCGMISKHTHAHSIMHPLSLALDRKKITFPFQPTKFLGLIELEEAIDSF